MSTVKPVFPGIDITVEGVYISDDLGEIVCWVYEEIEEDPEAWTASLRAVALAAAHGPVAVRRFLETAQGD
jgi:hypothetical protein